MILGFHAIAATLTTAAFLPQALHIIRYKDTRAISLIMYVAFASGVALWMVFGLMIGNLADHDFQRHHPWPDARHRGHEASLRVGVLRARPKSVYGGSMAKTLAQALNQLTTISRCPGLRACDSFHHRGARRGSRNSPALMRRRLRCARGRYLGRGACTQDLAQARRVIPETKAERPRLIGRSAPATPPRSAL